MISTSRTCPVCGRHFPDDVDRCLDHGVLPACADPLLGRIIDGKYEILSFVGMGGMSEVYRARHLELGRVLAIKFLKSTYSLDLQRFRREAISISQLEHANIAKVYAFAISAEGRPYMVMEYLEGTDLAEVLQNEQPLSLGRTLHIVEQIATGLGHAHARAIIHRDIKPSNIVLIDEPGNPETVKIVDFGTARIMREEANQKLTMEGEVIGTKEFISPEQFEGAPADERADIYALGMLAYQCVVYDARVPEAIQPLIRKTLAIDPAKRYRNTAELHEEIASIRESNSDQTRYVLVESDWQQPDRLNWHLLVLTAGVLFMGLVALLFWRQMALDRAKSDLIGSKTGPTNRRVLGRPALMEQAEAFVKQGQVAEAEEMCRAWIERARAEKHCSAEDEAEIGFVLAHARMALGDFEAAEPLWRHSIGYYEACKKKSLGSHLAMARNYLANTLICLNKLPEAEAVVRKNIEAAEEVGHALGETADAYAILAQIAKLTGRTQLSRQSMEQALAASEERNLHTALVHSELAGKYMEAGLFEQARLHLKTAVRNQERRQGENSTEAIKLRFRLADLLISQKDWAEARDLLAKNLDACRSTHNKIGEEEALKKLEQLEPQSK